MTSTAPHDRVRRLRAGLVLAGLALVAILSVPGSLSALDAAGSGHPGARAARPKLAGQAGSPGPAPFADTDLGAAAAPRAHTAAVLLPLVWRGVASTELPPPRELVAPGERTTWCDHVAAGPGGRRQPAELDLSAAHADIRFLGAAPRYAVVDQALTAALSGTAAVILPADAAGQAAFLRDYARRLVDVCALQADERPLGPARVDLIDQVAVVHPGSGPIVLPAGAKAVAVDLRDLPAAADLAPALAAAVEPALAAPVLPPARRVRFLDGATDEVFSATNVYTNSTVLQSQPPLTPTGQTGLPLALLTGPRLAPEAAELAGTLRLAGRAWLVGQDVWAAAAESDWDGIGAGGLAWRSGELVHRDAPLPPMVAMGLASGQDDPADAATASLRHAFTIDQPAAGVDVSLAGHGEAGLDLDLYVLFDRDGDGTFAFPAEVVGTAAGSTADEVVAMTLQEPGPYEAWVHGYGVPGGRATADLTVTVTPGYRWPDVVPADEVTLDPRSVLARLPGLGNPTVRPPGSGTRTTFARVDAFRDLQPVGQSLAELRAALLVLHGAYRRFYPYFEVVGDGIDERLAEVLQAELPTGAGRRHALRDLLRRMGEVTHDGHSFYYNYGPSWVAGVMPLQLEPVDEDAVVRRSLVPGINPGDTLTQIDGRPARDWYADEYRRTSAATDGYRFDLATRYLTSMTGPMDLEVRSPDGARRLVNVTPQPATVAQQLGPRYPRRAGLLTDLGAPDLYYINLDGAALDTNIVNFRRALTEAQQAPGMVLDMRGYPTNINHYEVAQRLIATSFTSPYFRVPQYTGPGERHIDQSQYSRQPLANPAYHGPLVLLVGPHSVSAAENFSLMLVGAHRVTVVGQRSAGTNGNLTGVQLPGGFAVTFTGMEILRPDGSRFHGQGIVPDVEVPIVATDLRDGIDREILTAIEVLRGRR